VYKIHITEPINKIIINDFIAVACHQNIASNNLINGHDIYHQNSWYCEVSQSIIGKLMIPETRSIIIKNCFIIKFIKYHLDMISIHTNIDNPKNIFNHIPPKTILA
jgi:hypothetical protein